MLQPQVREYVWFPAAPLGSSWYPLPVAMGLESRIPGPSGRRAWDTRPGQPPRGAEENSEWVAQETSDWLEAPGQPPVTSPAFPGRNPPEF